MEILSVTLKNFKSHSDRQFQFQPGTNAICGENGAGKTSILEAIAWTLFNYRGAYKNEDLIRNGAKSAQAIVTFVSSRDNRTYEVQRCTDRGYTLYDPQLGERLDYKHIEEEVLPWLRQQMGVSAGTDLGKLFANTIGVPQGTFTADFLQSPEKRKPIFDTILKVEEYRQTNQQMLSLEKYAKSEEENLERAIAQYEESLQEWESVNQQRQELMEAIAQDEAQLIQLQATLTQLQTEKDQLAQQAKQVQQLESALQNLSTQINAKQQANHRLSEVLEQAQQAAQICEANRVPYKGYLQVEETLKTLEQQVKQQQKILKQREKLQQQIAAQQTELTRLTVQLEALTKVRQELAQLQPAIQQQVSLEKQQQGIEDQLQVLRGVELERRNLVKQQTTIQHQQAELTTEIQRLQALSEQVERIPELEHQRDRLQEQLSRIEAAQQFEVELRQLLEQGNQDRDRHQQQAQDALALLQQMQEAVPLLAKASMQSVLEAIQAGVDLNQGLLDTLNSILSDLAEQTSPQKLKQHLKTTKQQLDLTYRQQAELATLEAKTVQLQESQVTAAQLQGHIETLQTQLATVPTWQEQRSHLTQALEALGNPRGRSDLLNRDLQQEPDLQAAHARASQAQAAIAQQMAQLEEQLTEFAELPAQIEQQQQLRQSHQEGYLIYLQHQKEANTRTARRTEYEAAIAQLQQLETERIEKQSQYETLVQDYDAERWQQVEQTYTEKRSQSDRIQGSLPQQRRLLQNLEHQWKTLQDLAEKRDRAKTELKQKGKVRKFITFARKVYKEAGPRITERYVQSISYEADRLFRELMNRPNIGLEWTRDYEILVQEGAHSRRFINLSGGEQMCAALAVRLALLRVLADIDVAFFDEPTTNMDRPRRESLAEAIANIKSFRQLFVISHDDTFEKVTENVILVEREPA